MTKQLASWDPLRIALALLIFLNIGRAHMHFQLEALRPALLLFSFGVAYAFLNPRALSREAWRTWPAWVVAGIGLVACGSLPFGISPPSSARYLVDSFSKVLLTAGLIIFATRGIRDVFTWIIAYVVACGMLVWYALFVFELSSGAGSFARLDDLYTYDANDVGLLLVVGIPLCLLMFEVGGRVTKFGALGVLVLSVWAVALTGSRGAFLSLAVVTVGLIAFSTRMSAWKRGVVLVAMGGMLWVAAPPGYWAQMGTIVDPEDDYNLTSPTGRKAIAIRGVGYMLEYPLFGLGLDNFRRAEGTISSVARGAMPGQGVRWSAPHNSYIQVAAELGVPGVVLFSTLVLGGLVGMTLVARRLARATEIRGDEQTQQLALVARYLALAYLGFTVGAVFLSFAYLDLIYLLTAMSVGVYLEKRRLTDNEDASILSSRGRRRGWVGMRGGLALADTRRSVEVEPPDDVVTPDR